jgi:argininosuccinate lyase
LGFTAVSQNSLDAVSDRDFAADFLYAAAMTGLHLSRLSEQLVLFSSAEFGFVPWTTPTQPAPASCRKRRTRTH